MTGLADFVRTMRALPPEPRELPGLADLVEMTGEETPAAFGPWMTLAIKHQARVCGVSVDQLADLEILSSILARIAAQPALTNCAELALAFGPQLLIHRLRRAALRTVEATDLHALPGDPPRLLTRPWILEAAEPGEALFGDTGALGGVPRPDGAIMLVGLLIPDGIYVAKWSPRWGEREIGEADGGGEVLLGEQTTRAEYAARVQHAARFALVLGMLLEAEGSPLRHSDTGGKLPSGAKPGPGKGWTVRTIHISGDQDARSRAPSPGVAQTMDGRAAVPVRVTGHLKRQPCGPGGKDRKTIYVSGYAARRWVVPEVDVRVT